METETSNPEVVGILNQTFFNNTIKEYLIVVGIFILSVVILKIFKTVVISRVKKLSEKTKTELDDMIISAINAIHWPFFVFVALYISTQFIVLNDKIVKIIYYLFLIGIVFYGIRFLDKLINYIIKKVVTSSGDDDTTIIKLLGTVAKIILWVGAALLLLSNMGIDVTSLMAGMGIGGIAIALALQNVLGDLFSSLSIYFDKPFKVGDYVSLGAGSSGTVKKIGLKTTRLQTPQGEELVVSNSELTKAQLSNFGVMKRRRTTFNIGVVYGTPTEKLKKISNYIKEIIESHGEMTDVARIHFTTFGDFSLIFTVVFYINSGSYDDFADIQENVNFKILEKFEEKNIEIAFPTQTLYVKK
ncbi:mechanosensitive ion channel family protein [Candidatus Parcubacteria bacterium]|nr:mechanosensitive ion channel family protein [Candidatus Parcubacteria bacterium]